MPQAKAKSGRTSVRPEANAAVRRTRVRNADTVKSSMVHVRLEDALKDEAVVTLDKIGISLPEAIRVFLKRVVREQAFPFRLEVPNAETAAALRESMVTTPQHFDTAENMFDALDKGGVR